MRLLTETAMENQPAEQVVQAPSSAVSDEQLVAMLVDRARNESLQLTGEGRLLQQLTKRVEVFAAVAAASGPVSGVELTRMVGRDAEIKNEVEKIRHRAYALEKRGWLVRETDGRFTLVSGAVGRDASPAGAGRRRPSGATA
ncbi:hypothetical protein [Streptomyces sp. NPDC059460]|uniref:hypothetical protein n=1 Tax=Streptomyces sp. NPDC059460 TaxID=3346840 RepID=UPI0036C68CD2